MVELAAFFVLYRLKQKVNFFDFKLFRMQKETRELLDFLVKE